MKRIFSLLTAAFAFARLAHAAPDQSGVARLSQLIVPAIDIQKGTVHDALNAIEHEWNRKYPDESFPIVTLEPQSDSLSGDPNQQWHLEKGSAYQMARLLDMTSHSRLDLVILKSVMTLDGEGSWTSVEIAPSEAVITALRLKQKQKSDDSQYDATETLKSFGIKFDPGCKATMLANRLLVVRNLPEEIAKIRGVFSLIDAGCSLRKTH